MSCGCNNRLAGLGELTDAEAMAIVKEELMKDSATILLEAAQGKFDTAAIATKRAVERICTKGAGAKITDFIKQYWWAIAIALVTVGYFVFKK